jgi:hypothetical protein
MFADYARLWSFGKTSRTSEHSGLNVSVGCVVEIEGA